MWKTSPWKKNNFAKGLLAWDHYPIHFRFVFQILVKTMEIVQMKYSFTPVIVSLATLVTTVKPILMDVDQTPARMVEPVKI